MTNTPAPDTPLTDAALAELLRVAEAATAGPWSIEECENECGVPYHHIFSDVKNGGTGEGVANTYHDNAFEMPSSVAVALERQFKRPVHNRTTAPVQGKRANAAHIAAFSPPTAAALVRECQRLRELLKVSNGEVLASVEKVAAKVGPILNENARFRADLAAAVTLLRESLPVVADAAVWPQTPELREFNAALKGRIDSFLTTQEAAK